MNEQQPGQGGVVGEVTQAAGTRSPQDAELAAMKKIDSVVAALEPLAAQRVLNWCHGRALERLQKLHAATAPKTLASPALAGAVRACESY